MLGKGRAKYGGDAFLLMGLDAIEEGKSQCAARQGFGERERCSVAVLLQGWLQVDGWKVAAGGYSVTSQFRLYRVAIDGL